MNFNDLCSNVVPAGTYKASVTDAKFKVSGVGINNTQIQVTYTILEGAYAKRTIVETIGAKAFSFKLLPLLKACKVDVSKDFNTPEELYNYGVKELKNKVLLVDVIIKPYQGTNYNNISGYRAESTSTTSTEDVIAELGLDPKVEAPELKSEPTETDVPEQLDINLDFVDDDNPF